ncbi:MAG: 50S ribosomal protein L4 [Candidatus Altiarchaeota archaeon]
MVAVYSIDGKIKEEIKLPNIFSTGYRPDLIQRAVVAFQSKKRQKYATSEEAGMRTSAAYFGRRRKVYRTTINRGISRLPREKTGGGGLGKVRRVPQSVKGRKAHPPKVEKIYEKKINKKEYTLALKSAIAALANKELAEKRGHKISKLKDLPIVVEDSFEKIAKTKDFLKFLNSINLGEELLRAEKRKVRSGKGKMRGRRYKRKKSLLLVVSSDSNVLKSSKNIPGIDAIKVDDLNIELLAPGTHAGRLSLWTKSAIERVEDLFKKEEK